MSYLICYVMFMMATIVEIMAWLNCNHADSVAALADLKKSVVMRVDCISSFHDFEQGSKLSEGLGAWPLDHPPPYLSFFFDSWGTSLNLIRVIGAKYAKK